MKKSPQINALFVGLFIVGIIVISTTLLMNSFRTESSIDAPTNEQTQKQTTGQPNYEAPDTEVTGTPAESLKIQFERVPVVDDSEATLQAMTDLLAAVSLSPTDVTTDQLWWRITEQETIVEFSNGSSFSLADNDCATATTFLKENFEPNLDNEGDATIVSSRGYTDDTTVCSITARYNMEQNPSLPNVSCEITCATLPAAFQ